MNSDSIPIDLIVEILSRLPVKSVSRFRCVSKQWASILGRRPYFKELFLTRSTAKPCLLFAIEEDGTWSFFSLPQRQNPYENPSPSFSSSLVAAAEFQMDFAGDDMWIHHYTIFLRDFVCGYASGLICFYSMTIKENDYEGAVIFNPNTNRYLTLPYLERYDISSSFFGFDPVEKQFKVLFMADPSSPDDHHRIITLGTGMKWRKIECSLIRHVKVSEGICINGVLYYLGEMFHYVNGQETFEYMIVCFDVRYEKFKFIDVEWFPRKLINYKGKLAMVDHYYTYDNNVIELYMWVLENVEKQEWSKYAYTLSEDQFYHREFTVVGATASGEIVFSVKTYSSHRPFYVFYFNPERNTFQSVEIQGFGEYLTPDASMQPVYTFVDHVEDLDVKIRFEKEKTEKDKTETIIEE